MWRSISHIISGIRLKKRIAGLSRICRDRADDETSSNASAEDGLECPICCESFDVVEHVPCVLWCGHTLCRNCVLALKCAAFKFPTQTIWIPFLIYCPWCNFLTFRLVYNGSLKFPSSNYFLLWMVESRNKGMRRLGCSRSCGSGSFASEGDRQMFNFRNSGFMDKFPLVILLLILVFALSSCVAVLLLHLVTTVFFAVPALLVLYFVYRVLNWLGRQMRI